MNTEIDILKATVVKLIKAGIPVFFGCDVGKFSDSALGIMDTDLYDINLGFNVTLGMSKSQRLQSGESVMTHAMVLTGVQIEGGKPVRWRVQNSYGESGGDKGYWLMTDKWMDEFVYQVVVSPQFVSKEIRDILKQKPHALPLWDPIGALA